MTMTVACCGADGTLARRVLGLSHDHAWPNLTALATGDLGQLVAVAEPDARLRARLARLVRSSSWSSYGPGRLTRRRPPEPTRCPSAEHTEKLGHAERTTLLDRKGGEPRRCARQGRQEEQHVKVRPRLPEQLEPVRQADRDESRQHRRRREPHPARGSEDGDVEGTRLSRREVDR